MRAAPELRPPNASAFAAFDHLATMVAVVSTDGACVFANASFENVLGLSRRSVQRSPMFDWFVDPQRVRDTVAAVSRNDFSTSRLEAQLRRPGGSHPEPLLVHVIVNQMEASSNVVIELVEIEQQTRQDREERALDQAQVTKELIRNLAHEIKNPLGGIRGAAQLLGADVGPEGRELTDLIQAEVDRVTRLVERLEHLADVRPLVRAPVNLHEVLQHVRALARGFAPELRVREFYDPSLPPVEGDREALIQLFLNLVKNAAEATENKGEIILTTAYRHGHRVDGRKLPLLAGVSDNGPGLASHVAQRLFQPFATTKPSGGGLGLALVAKIAADHGGAVSHAREAGHTIFRVALASAPVVAQ